MIYGNYLKTVPSHCEQRNNDKVKKTISKMAELPKKGVRKVVFLNEVDFSNNDNEGLRGHTQTK